MIRLPIDKPGRYYDCHKAIVVRTGLPIEQERRYLWHELEHADRRDRVGHTNAKVERLVERHAAENAMPWLSVQWSWTIATDLHEMAGLLKLPVEWVRFRLGNLHPVQKAVLRDLNGAERHAP